MDSDDDFQSLKDQSPEVQLPMLKRLKRVNPKSPTKSLFESFDDPIMVPSVDFAKLEALENDYEILDDNDFSNDRLFSGEPLSGDVADENEVEKEDDLDSGSDELVKPAKRVLDFDHDDDVVDRMDTKEADMDFEQGEIGKEVGAEILENGRVNKKKKIGETRDRVKEVKVKGPGLNKRREEKERKAYLMELHAESQRLLRDTRDAAFVPMPIIQKPISSILEKIRKRKLQISKKAYAYGDSDCPRDKMNLDENAMKNVENDVGSNLISSDENECKEIAGQTNHPTIENSLDEELPQPFRAPVHDTQDLFEDSQSKSTSESLEISQDSILKEEFVPTLTDMELKFDSSLMDDSSLDEDNDKENVEPHPDGISSGYSPKCDPVKNFVDDEAEEEDDSDNDPDNLDENEDVDAEEFEELEDMIATEYEEQPVDNDKRNELHQQWLERQDAVGTDNLLQRLKCGSVVRDTNLSNPETDSDEEDEEFDDEAQQPSVPNNSGRVTITKAKQLILQMFSHKEDVYLSDNDEDKDLRHTKQHLVIRREKQDVLVPPADDENSREVFGLIKKLNIVTDNKRKPKPSSFFEAVLTGGKDNSFSKSSFLGRVTNHPIPVSHKQVSGAGRSFIFGRDDSNSRSSITASEDSSDAVSREIHQARRFTAKFTKPQSKFSIVKKSDAANTASKTSLLEILKRSSSKSHICDEDSSVDLTKSIFTLKAPKKPLKIGGRS